MARQNKAVKAHSDEKSRAKVKRTVVEKLSDDLAGLAQLPGGPIAAVGGSTIQAARLGDVRLQSVQRQALAAQIGRVQGNQHLQRIAAFLKPDEDEAGRTSTCQRAPSSAAEPSLLAEGTTRSHATQQPIQRTPDDGQVPSGVTHSRRGNIVSITIPREHAGSSRSVANVINAVLESAYVARNRRLASGMRFMSQIVSYLATVPPDRPRIPFNIRLVREGGRVNRIEFADVEMEVEETEMITGQAPRREGPRAPEPERERRPGEWYIENNRLYPGFRISAFRGPGAGAGAGATVDISTVRVNSVGVGWCTFIREYANDVVVFAQLDEISQERIRVTWLRFQNNRVTPFGVDATHPASMDRGEIGNRLSFERAQHLRVWQPIMVGVAWGTASVLTLGFGPGAGVVGQGSALAGEGFLVNAIAGGLGGAITQFLQESMQAMMQAEDPAHFYRETNWSQFARRVIINAITNAIGGAAGEINLPGGGYGFFDQIGQFLAQYMPRVTTNLLGTLANRMFEDVGREEGIRRLRERYRSASGEERQRIERQLQQMTRQHSTRFQGDLRSTIRDLWVQALQSVPSA